MTHKKVKYKSGDMPFSIYSSSVNTGYASDISAMSGLSPTAGPRKRVGGIGEKLYWIDDAYNSSTIVIYSGSINPSGSSGPIYTNTSAEQAYGISIDNVNNKIYWTESSNPSSPYNAVFKKCDLDGDNVETVFTPPDTRKVLRMCLAQSGSEGKIIYSTLHDLYTCSLDGDLDGIIFDSGAGTTYFGENFTYSPATEKIYARYNLGGIKEWNIDGTGYDWIGGVQSYSDEGKNSFQCEGMACDNINKKLYWTFYNEGSEGWLYSSSMDPTSAADTGLISSSTNDDFKYLTQPVVDPVAGKVYLPNAFNDRVMWRFDLNGANPEIFAPEDLGRVWATDILYGGDEYPGPNFDITNLHEDTYGAIKGAPMQGPFTYQYVGGNQHRHVPLNEGIGTGAGFRLDNPSTRSELFKINFVSSSGEIKVVTPATTASFYDSETISSSLEVLQDSQTHYARIEVDSLAGKMYWTEVNDFTIVRADVVPDAPEEILVDIGVSGLNSVVLDIPNQLMYWGNYDDGTIVRCGMDLPPGMSPSNRSDIVILQSGLDTPLAIVLDPTSNKMFFTDGLGGADTIYATTTVPGATRTSVTTTPAPTDIAYNHKSGYIYFSDSSTGAGIGGIYRVFPDGTGREQIYGGGAETFRVTAIALDESASKIYWSEFETGALVDPLDRMGRANLDMAPSSITYFFTGSIKYAQGIALDLDSEVQKIYWTDTNVDAISRADIGIRKSAVNALYTRGEVAKRPLNIANHKTYNPLGNFTYDYEVIQTTGRTSNNRSFVEAEGVGFIGDPNLPYSGSLVTQFVSGARDFTTGTALPTFTRGETVFVNRFNAPGGTDVSSLGVLDTYAEEFAPNNAMPWRNNAVRSVLRSDLTRHTPKATNIACSVTPTLYHSNNRNTRYYKQTPPTASIDTIYTATSGFEPRSIALDAINELLYYHNDSDDKIYKIPTSGLGTPTEVASTDPAFLALDACTQTLYWSDFYSDVITKMVLPDGTPSTFISAQTGGPTGVDLDLDGQMIYWAETAGTDQIYRAPLATGTPVELLYQENLPASNTTVDIALDIPRGMMYWTDVTADRIFYARMDGTSDGHIQEVLLSPHTDPRSLQVDSNAEKVYFTCESGVVMRMNLDGSGQEVLVGTPGTSDQDPWGLALDVDAGIMYYSDDDAGPSPSDVGGIFRTTMPEKPLYDNGFITHAIPQCSLQYAWIKASAITNRTELLGYQTSGSY